jgi:hypothetical protein
MSSTTEDADSLTAEICSLEQRVGEAEQCAIVHQEPAAAFQMFYLLVISAPDAIVVTDLH